MPFRHSIDGDFIGLNMYALLLTVICLFSTNCMDNEIKPSPDLKAQTTPDCTSTTSAGEELKLKLAEEKAIESAARVKFVEVVEDSRCPEGANCVWAGVAKIKIQLSDGSKSEIVELNTNELDKVVKFGSVELKLVSLDPYPKMGAEIPKNSYSAILSVTKPGC